MKVGFIGLGGMGQVMARRLIDGWPRGRRLQSHAPKRLKPLTDVGAKAMASIKDAANYGAVVFTMLADDAAVLAVVGQAGGLQESLPQGWNSHLLRHAQRRGRSQAQGRPSATPGRSCIAAPDARPPRRRRFRARPACCSAGRRTASTAAGPCSRRSRGAASRPAPDPAAAAAIKIANNFVLGCAIEAMGEGFALVRKYGVAPEVFYDVLTDGLFACSAYKVYGKIITEERYLPAGFRAILGSRTPISRSPPARRRACRCRAAMFCATGSSAPSPTAKANTIGR